MLDSFYITKINKTRMLPCHGGPSYKIEKKSVNIILEKCVKMNFGIFF